MVKAKVYFDTSVPSAYFDERAPDRQQWTQEFWSERLPVFEPVISTSVLVEIRNTPDADKRNKMEHLVRGFQVLESDKEADRLTQEYVKRGIFPEKYKADASHVAIAVVNRVGYLVSWNFKHLVKVKTRREIN